MSPQRRAMAWMAVAAALWVTLDDLAEFLDLPYSAFQVVWTRYGVHLLFMLVLWGWREPRTLWQTRRPLLQVSRSVLMVIIGFCGLYALDRMASASPLSSMTPIVALQVAFTICSQAVLHHSGPGLRALVGASLVWIATYWTWMRKPASNPTLTAAVNT